MVLLSQVSFQAFSVLSGAYPMSTQLKGGQELRQVCVDSLSIIRLSMIPSIFWPSRLLFPGSSGQKDRVSLRVLAVHAALLQLCRFAVEL